MKKIKALMLVLAVLALASCAVQRSSLRSAAEHGAFLPRAAYVYEAAAGLTRTPGTFVLMPTRYEAVGQDDLGVWYLGEKDSFLSWSNEESNRRDGKKVIAAYRGGVFVPHDKSTAAKLFYTQASENIYLVDPSTVRRAERSPISGGDYLGEAWNQAFTIGPVSGATMMGAGIGAAIAIPLTEYNAEGFFFYNTQPPKDARSLRSWLTEVKD